MNPRRAHLTNRGLYRSFYDALGRHSRFSVMPVSEPRMAWTLDHIRPTDDVIDIGCDKGQMTVPIRVATSGRVVGLEISESSVTFNRTNLAGEGIEWLCAEAEAIPVPDNTFDVAVLCEILEHVVDPALCIAEAERIVRPGGSVVISVPIDAEELERHGGLADNRRAGYELDGHVRDYDPGQELADRHDLTYRPATGRGANADFKWWLAAYTVTKEAMTAAA